MEILRTIALAEDDADLSQAMEAVIRRASYDFVGHAFDGVEAVSLVQVRKPQVLLLDIHMPKMSGLEAMKRIVPLQTTAVVILTADASPALAREALDAGASAYLHKPFHIDSISPMLETVWHHFFVKKELQRQNGELSQTLELRKLTEKAKGILMEQQGFSEEEAHQCLIRMSQDQGIALQELCRSIIQVKMVLGSRAAVMKKRIR